MADNQGDDFRKSKGIFKDPFKPPVPKRKHKICPVRSSLGGEKNCSEDTCAWWTTGEYESGKSFKGCCIPIGIDTIERMVSAFEDDNADGDQDAEPDAPAAGNFECIGCGMDFPIKDGILDNDDEYCCFDCNKDIICDGCGDPVGVGFIQKDGKNFCADPCQPGDDEEPDGDDSPENILPLKRGDDGKLGVESDGDDSPVEDSTQKEAEGIPDKYKYDPDAPYRVIMGPPLRKDTKCAWCANVIKGDFAKKDGKYFCLTPCKPDNDSPAEPEGSDGSE